MIRRERVWGAVLLRICEAPPELRHEACEALWRAVLGSQTRAELEAIAVMLFSLDNVARHVPGDVHDEVWRLHRDRPCTRCGRFPCGLYCTGGRSDRTN